MPKGKKAEKELCWNYVIPAPVMWDEELTPQAKLLYGVISGLANAKGYCWATNNYLEELFKCSENTMLRLLNSLIDKKYLAKKIIYSEINPKQVIERRLYVVGEKIAEHLN
ncbi:MAG: helix-turn-helix domain-containing protein [Firmicutes bacterium]|nr:helix-turn-helix domain-containing protein [Bacillota bacterium]